MVTRFKLKKDAEAFVRELKERGVTSHVYKGHRDFAVEYDDNSKITEMAKDFVKTTNVED